MIALIVLASLAALAGGLLLYVHSRPDYATVARGIRIQATAQAVFPFLNDLRLFGAWSPYEQLDPAARRRFSAVTRGTGAVYEWDGNHKLGSGRLEIIDSAPAKRVILELDFFRPFKANSLVEFSLRPVSGGTEVRWEMDGPRPFFVKLVSLFLDLDAIQGREFDKGLAALKAPVEGPEQPKDY
ncbi:MAG TPA: SRPBCC family protein [Gammaproteobacteria bacterium]|nr:SRPBCC family protein [Gammaproteobacteria bacterium]